MSFEPPILLIGSSCSKKFRPQHVAARPGWADVPGVRNGQWHEVKSPLILQPRPAAMTDGLHALHRTIIHWSRART
jgi:iron complex transport system substrate-binding protein